MSVIFATKCNQRGTVRGIEYFLLSIEFAYRVLLMLLLKALLMALLMDVATDESSRGLSLPHAARIINRESCACLVPNSTSFLNPYSGIIIHLNRYLGQSLLFFSLSKTRSYHLYSYVWLGCLCLHVSLSELIRCLSSGHN